VRFRAARPVTFFVLAKKVTKESRAFEGIQQRRVWRRWHGDGVNPLGDAAAVRGGSGAVPGVLSERPQGASFAHGPLTTCSAREAEGRPRAVPFFGDFLWRSKESYRAAP